MQIRVLIVGARILRRVVLLITLGLGACASLPHPPGYNVRLMVDKENYHPPAKYYLSLDPIRNSPLNMRIRDGRVLTQHWVEAAQASCGERKLEVAYGPQVTQTLLPYCDSPNADELDWCLGVYGYFSCSENLSH